MDIAVFNNHYDVSVNSARGFHRCNQDSYAWVSMSGSSIITNGTVQPGYEGMDCFFAIVCDGMGGMPDGEFASQSIVNGAVEWFKLVEKTEIITLCAELKAKVVPQLEKRMLDRYPESGTTFSALIALNDVWMSINLGDSRCYAFYDNGRMFRTLDHTPVEQRRSDGLISEDEMRFQGDNNLVNCYIGGQCCGEIRIHDISGFRTALICSDGVHDNLSAEQLRVSVENGDARALVEQCITCGAEDDVTAIVIRKCGRQVMN